MILLDHLLFLVLAVVHPVLGFFSFRRLLRRIAAGERIDRAHLYNMTMIGHWTLFAVALALWAGAGRDWQMLGLGLNLDARFLAGIVLTALGIVFLVRQVREVDTADQDDIRTVHRALGKLDVIIPRNGNELGRFYALSTTAGIVEELLWRGYIIWYLASFMPIWVAALLSAVLFGIAHAYQGPANLPRITLVGIAFAGLYLLTGSVWLPMILHAAVDILQGRMAYGVVRRFDTNGPTDTMEGTVDAAQ
jgi:membrane protease YdiL (CAAX protease family)